MGFKAWPEHFVDPLLRRRQEDSSAIGYISLAKLASGEKASEEATTDPDDTSEEEYVPEHHLID